MSNGVYGVCESCEPVGAGCGECGGCGFGEVGQLVCSVTASSEQEMREILSPLAFVKGDLREADNEDPSRLLSAAMKMERAAARLIVEASRLRKAHAGVVEQTASELSAERTERLVAMGEDDTRPRAA